MSRKAKFLLALAGFAVLALLLAAAGSFISARVVTLRCREVIIPGLPPEFDGTSVLFVSDLRAGALSTPGQLRSLMGQLTQLRPDLIILGGDYTGDLFWDQDADGPTLRLQLFSALSTLEAPLGKFCVPGDLDRRLDQRQGASLSDACLMGGFVLLSNQAFPIEKDGATLVLLGLDDWTRGSRDTDACLAALDGVGLALCVSHSPDALPSLLEKCSCVRLALCGHTLGGQIRLPFFDMNPSVYGGRFRAGETEEAGVPVIVTQGIGTSRLPLRWGTQADAYIITLRTRE